MTRRQFMVACLGLLLAVPTVTYSKGGGSKGTAKKSSSSSSKSVGVHSYKTKTGKTVKSYKRAAPGTATHAPKKYTPHYKSSLSSSHHSAHTSSFGTGPRTAHLSSPSKVPSWVHRPTVSHGTANPPRDSHGKIKRSASAKSDFRKSHPCPSTGKTSGACPGYEVDHRNPLACGGADMASNMQWLTTAQNRSKGAAGCRR